MCCAKPPVACRFVVREARETSTVGDLAGLTSIVPSTPTRHLLYAERCSRCKAQPGMGPLHGGAPK